ncbi:MAG: PilZ domain-containing protein [Myxococcales bacterium]|nr:PilZ domain-containing protein [Myxococcales bacterium]MCB9701616.1 PilZ domain-containing protein [Myxococcales bacterium]
MAEARFHPRLRIHANADIIGTEVLLAAPVEDVSLGGCKFAGPAWEEVGAPVTMILSFPDLGEINLPLTGVIVRASERDMAVRFQGLSDEQKALLKKHVDESVEAST